MDQEDYSNILFFDGVCTICNGFVDIMLKIDKKKKLYFASLQGKQAAQSLPADLRQQLNTVVFLSHEQIFTQSDAILQAFRQLGGPWKYLFILRVIPKFIRDFFYRLVAENRFLFFKPKEACRVPSEEEKGRFLD